MRVFLHIWSHQIVNMIVHICLIHLPTIFNRFNFTVHDLVYFILSFTQTRLVGFDKKGIYPVSVELLYCFMTESLSVWNGRYNKSLPLEPWWLIIPSVSTNMSSPQASPPRKWRNACEGDRGAVSFLCNPLWSHFQTMSRESWMGIVLNTLLLLEQKSIQTLATLWRMVSFLSV